MTAGACLGIDTSNYTTSAALLRDGVIVHSKKLLPVAEGKLGLRQSDALFHHVRQLPEVLEPLLPEAISAIGVSDKPRNVPGSYMPCFLAGANTASVLAKALGVPLYRCSHQQGHLAAALYSAGQLSLMHGDFIAFHLSGGTSEGLLIKGGLKGSIHIVSQTLDLNAGQAVDRTGVLLGLPFPAGKELESLALSCNKSFSVKPALKGNNFSLSGVQNKCEKMKKDGCPPQETAAFCLSYLITTIEKVTQNLVAEYGNLPILFAGGVASNSMMRKRLSEKFGALFAAPEFSADNAAGPAILAAWEEGWPHE